jgi:hypothetical protein
MTGSADDATWVVLVGLASCVLPTLVFAIVRARHAVARPLAALAAAWLAMWVGQLAVPVAGSCVVCVGCAIAWLLEDPMAAVVYGVAMTLVTAWVAVLAMRLFALGARLLAADGDRLCAAYARAIMVPAGMLVLAVVFYTTTVLAWVPMPGGQWMPLVYFALVLVPTGLAALLVWLVAFLLRGPPWQ